MSEWVKKKLSNYIKIKHGFAFPGTGITSEESENILVTPGNFNYGGGFKSDKFKFFNGIVPEEYIFKGGEIIVTMTDLSQETDTLGLSAKVPINENKNYLHNQRVGLVTFLNNEIHPDYCYWLMRTREYQESIVNSASGTSIMHTSPDRIASFEASFPPLPEQQAIAEVLSSLDDKIDLLHRNNKTLEALAETLFRQWFLDTEFNSTINDVAEVLNGYAFKSSEFSSEGKNYVIKIKNIGGSSVNISDCDRISDNTANKTNNKFKVLSGDVLFAMTGAELGKMGIVGSTTRSLWLNQRVGSIKDRFNGSRYLAYLALNSELGQDFILNTASGSAQPNISGVDISRCPFPSISPEQIEEKSEVLNNLFDKVIHNLGQISILKETRDTLLPKLMSGQVVVN